MSELWSYIDAASRRPVESWVVDFYRADEEGKPSGEKIDTQEVYRANAPTRWADNHAYRLKRQLQGAQITYEIIRIG
jgi:hypothetical protein